MEKLTEKLYPSYTPIVFSLMRLSECSPNILEQRWTEEPIAQNYERLVNNLKKTLQQELNQDEESSPKKDIKFEISKASFLYPFLKYTTKYTQTTESVVKIIEIFASYRKNALLRIISFASKDRVAGTFDDEQLDLNREELVKLAHNFTSCQYLSLLISITNLFNKNEDANSKYMASIAAQNIYFFSVKLVIFDNEINRVIISFLFFLIIFSF
jgi:hypothetical protein